MQNNKVKTVLIVILSTALIVISAKTAHADPFAQGGTPLPPFLPGFEPGGPYYQQIYLANSTDGLTWQTDDVIIRNHSSVPSIIRWSGTLWMYVADPAQNSLIVLRQDDDLWWETRVQIEGFDPAFAVDPDVILLSSGQLRLFFLDIRTIGALATSTTPRRLATIHSAVTSDGIHFTLEEGARFQSENDFTDPDVVQAADGTWWLFVTAPGGSLAAHSADGMTFEEAGHLSDGAFSDSVRLDDGTLRQYYCLSGVRSRVSTDGLTWTSEDGVRIEVRTDAEIRGQIGSPSVIREADGSWLMAYFVDATPSDLWEAGSGNDNPGP